ncbi:hypothetical protein KR032_007714 [Drosophila birchii]|nr:hypothetical protein KR032_007714 [Drosophila birchii]
MSSLINFLNPKFNPTVVTKAGCEDGFTAANLIADDADQFKRGFMCLAACKPPVEIVFNFPKAVDMKVIKLWPTIRALRSTAFELHGRQNDNWERVAIVKDLAHDVESVTFCHQSEYNSQSSSNAAAAAAAASATTGQPQSEKVFFFKTSHKILASTNGVKVIIRATDDCPPVLGKVEMWGLPARSLDKADKELVTSIWSEISSDNSLVNTLPPLPPSTPRPVLQLREQSTLSIPEEFLDCITWDLMVVPTVLPSGKVVDQSTITKHAAAEAKWGRKPSDPFTSLEYNDQRKTMVNMELKKRIEEFLVEHPGDFEEMPQASGSSGVNRIGPYVMGQDSSGFGPSSALGMAQNISEFDTSHREEQLKRRSTGISTSTSPKRMRCSHQPGASTSTSAPWLTINHQQSSRLNGNPGSAAPSIRCINCRSAQFRYKIRTCRHYVCVYCLVQLSGEQVCACKVPFQDADVEQCCKVDH